MFWSFQNHIADNSFHSSAMAKMLFLLLFLFSTVEPNPQGPEGSSDIPENPTTSPRGREVDQQGVRKLELRSNGGAGEYKGGYMGHYI